METRIERDLCELSGACCALIDRTCAHMRYKESFKIASFFVANRYILLLGAQKSQGMSLCDEHAEILAISAMLVSRAVRDNVPLSVPVTAGMKGGVLEYKIKDNELQQFVAFVYGNYVSPSKRNRPMALCLHKAREMLRRVAKSYLGDVDASKSKFSNIQSVALLSSDATDAHYLGVLESHLPRASIEHAVRYIVSRNTDAELCDSVQNIVNATCSLVRFMTSLPISASYSFETICLSCFYICVEHLKSVRASQNSGNIDMPADIFLSVQSKLHSCSDDVCSFVQDTSVFCKIAYA